MSIEKKNMGRQSESQVNDSCTERLVRKFLEMLETDYMRIVVIPALEAEGFTRVDYHHGANEIGKDLIFTRDGGFGKKELFVAVVKAEKLTKSATGSNGFPTVVTQLFQAAKNKVTLWEGEARMPDGVFLILADNPSCDVINSNIGGFQELSGLRVRFILGSDIAKSIIEHRKDIAEQILETSINVDLYLDGSPTNEPLLLALNSTESVDMNSIFMDLDASVGSTRMRSALNLEPVLALSPVKVKADRWRPVASAVMAFQERLGTVLAVSLEESEEDYKKERAKALSTENVSLIKQVKDECDSLVAWIKSAKQEFVPSRVVFQNLNKIKICAEKDLERLYGDVEGFFDQCSSLDEKVDFEKINLFHESEFVGVLSGAYEIIYCFSQWVAPLCEKSKEIERGLQDFRIYVVSRSRLAVREQFCDVALSLCRALNRYSSDANDALRRRSQSIARATMIIGEPDYSLDINPQKLGGRFSEARTRLLDRFGQNSAEPSGDAKALLHEAKSFLGAINAINDVPELKSSFFQNKTETEFLGELNWCVLNLLDSGEDILVVGSAGSGKSTTLEMFSRRSFSKKAVGEEVIFLPLAKLLAVDCKEFSGAKAIDYFSNEASKLLRMSRPGVTKKFVKTALEDAKKIRLVVDGIDEAIWILPLLSDFVVQMRRRKGLKFQLVASSRFPVSELECLGVFTLELLPFSKDQVDRFIRNYLARQPELAERVVGHVKSNQGMYSVAQTPLMSTILCTLAQHGIALPHTRIALYKERFDLLWGAYDSRKAISRVKSTRSFLEDVSKKVAYYLHSRKIRSAEKEALLDYVLTTLGNRYEAAKIELAFDELVRPCNVITVDWGGNLGLGHLTYQEYLASDELYTNRQGDMAIHLSDPWWEEVLVLAAIRSDDIGDLISNRIRDTGLIGEAYSTLRAMVDVASGTQKKTLTKLLEMHSLRDGWVDDSDY